MFDLDMIKQVYNTIPHKIDNIKNKINHPLTFTEKILYTHQNNTDELIKGNYADFLPDRVALQDATAQMALLQLLVII